MNPIIREPELAFENALKKGMQEPEKWMYMYSDTDKRVQNIDRQ